MTHIQLTINHPPLGITAKGLDKMHYKKAVAGQISAGRQGIVPDRRPNIWKIGAVKLHGFLSHVGMEYLLGKSLLTWPMDNLLNFWGFYI